MTTLRPATQIPLFTVRGNPWEAARAAADLRANVIDSLAGTFGSTSIDEPCPLCDSRPIRIVLRPGAPVAVCLCGWSMEVTA